MTKRLFLLLLTLAMVFTVACSKSDDAKVTEETSKVEEKKEEPKVESKEENKEEPQQTAEALKDKQVFVDAKWAKDLIDGKTEYKNFIVSEVTWGEAKDSPDYLNEHLPGAIHFNTDWIEEGPVWNIKSDEDIEKALLDNGVTKNTVVLLYGPDTGVHRVAYTMLYAGVDRVLVLDGGLKAWKDAGYEVESGEVKPTAVTEFGATVPVHPEYWLSLEEAKEKLSDENFRLVSVRSEEEWKGETSGYGYINKAGEPKGAYWGKSGNGNSGMEFYQDENGKNRSFDEIVAMWKENGINTDNELSFYCGTGWRACLPWLMCYERGIEATLYDGGWNEWQMHDELEVQVGDPKDANVEYKKVSELSDDKALKK